MKAIGEKIKSYRARTGMSQLDLELEMEASPGMISRIERGKVNPTKETVGKIADILKLNTFEKFNLFNLGDDKFFSKILNISFNVQDTQNKLGLVKLVVDELVEVLNIYTAILVEEREGYLYGVDSTQHWSREVALKIIGRDFSDLRVSLKEDTNYFVKCYKEQSPIYSSELSDFACPAINKDLADRIQKLTKVHSFIAVPVINRSNMESIACVLFVKDYEDDFYFEKEVLSTFCEGIGLALGRISR